MIRRLSLIAMLVTLPAVSAEVHSIYGIVRDVSGSPISFATVTIVASEGTRQGTTGGDGRFQVAFPADRGSIQIEVTAAGFLPSRIVGRVERDAADIEIVLETATFNDAIVVTPSRVAARAGDTAPSVAVVSRENLDTTAALTLDDKLRQVPGFSLLRRSGSRVANPTSQGVSLRGIAPSGASRALVLDDGIPLNDPFGGWIYWSRIPQAAIDSVEVLRGSASDLYGSAAMGGVVQILRRAPGERELSLRASAGSEQTWDGSLLVARQLGPAFATIVAQGFSTGGYILVEPAARGLVDTRSGSRNSSFELTASLPASDRSHLFVRGSHFRESRENGTALQTNNTRSNQWSIGAGTRIAAAEFSMRSYVSDQDYEQVFSAIGDGRAAERLTIQQSVPSRAAGFTISGNKTAGSRHRVVLGIDHRRVSGTSDEENFSVPGGALLSTGGKQTLSGLFAQDVVGITTRLSLIPSLRFDQWRNFDGSISRIGATTDRVDFDARNERSWSPRFSLLYRTSESLAFTASAYRAFRAPTLNELYRSFRVGNIVTNANTGLRSERLRGGEAGAVVSAGRSSLRLTIFSMEIDRTVANVTQSITPSLITRQRQNLGSSRSRGLELNTDYRVSRRWALEGGLTFLDSTVRSFSANRRLEGLRVPQVPRSQGALQVRFSGDVMTASVQLRGSGPQFDDDLNQLRLGSFLTIDGFAAREVSVSTSLFAAIENLTNESYAIGRTPVTTLGGARTLRIGVRYDLPWTRSR